MRGMELERAAVSQPAFFDSVLTDEQKKEYGKTSRTAEAIVSNLLKAVEEGKPNAILSYKNSASGYRLSDAKDALSEVKWGTTGYGSLVALVQWLGPYVGVEMFSRAVSLAAERGDYASNYYLYLDEVKFKFWDADGKTKSTSGSYVQQEIMRWLSGIGIKPELKITAQAADEFYNDKARMRHQIIFYQSLIQDSSLPASEKEEHISKLKSLNQEIYERGTRQRDEVKGLYGEAERIHSFFTNALHKPSGAPAAAPVRGFFVTAQEEPLFGLESLGEGKPSDAVLAKLGVLSHGEDGELRFNANSTIYKRAIAEYDSRYQESRGMLANDISKGRMSGRHKYFLSKVAEHAAKDMGAEISLPGKEGRRLAKIIRQGKLYSEEVMVDGKRVPAILALSEMLKGRQAAPAKEIPAPFMPALSPEAKKPASSPEPGGEIKQPPVPEAPAQAGRGRFGQGRKSDSRFAKLGRAVREWELGRIAPGEKEEEQSPAENAREYIKLVTGGEAILYRIDNSTISNFAKEALLSAFGGWISEKLEKLPEEEREKRLAILPQVMNAYVSTVERRERVDLAPDAIEKEFKSRLGE